EDFQQLRRPHCAHSAERSVQVRGLAAQAESGVSRAVANVTPRLGQESSGRSTKKAAAAFAAAHSKGPSLETHYPHCIRPVRPTGRVQRCGRRKDGQDGEDAQDGKDRQDGQDGQVGQDAQERQDGQARQDGQDGAPRHGEARRGAVAHPTRAAPAGNSLRIRGGVTSSKKQSAYHRPRLAKDFRKEVEALRPYLVRYASMQLRSTDAVEDVVQETLLAALAAEATFAGRSNLRTWITGILKHKIIDVIRQS